MKIFFVKVKAFMATTLLVVSLAMPVSAQTESDSTAAAAPTLITASKTYTNTKYFTAKSPTNGYGVTMSVYITGKSTFVVDPSNTVNGTALTLTYSNPVNVTSFTQGGVLFHEDMSGTGYVRRAFTAFNDSYYMGGSFQVTCTSTSYGNDTKTYTLTAKVTALGKK